VEQRERIEIALMAPKPTDGKDELNLVEFPLCTLAHRLRPDQKTLQFEDRVWDSQRNGWVPRHFTVTGSDAYGLPTALDDEVLLGLVQVTKLRGFAEREVPFTRYQLIQILGWRHDSKSYERIEESLNRWTGVTLYYQNAWWNKARQCWVDAKFHVLDNVWLCHRGDLVEGGGDDVDRPPLSAFVWNDVVFRSFQAGNLKSIDFEFFKQLDSAVAKRLYRFLDKRFFHKRQWEFSLHELAWEHVGLARGYDTASLKRKLRTGIAELEAKGYLTPMSDAQRFRKVCARGWRVAFTKVTSMATSDQPSGQPSEDESLAGELIARGVTPATAADTVQNASPEHIRAQLEVFDWLIARRDPRVSRNPPGFLVSAIKSHYSTPRDFTSWQEQARRYQQGRERRRRLQAHRQEKLARERTTELAQEERLQEFWRSLSEAQRQQIEQEALAQAPLFQRKLIARGGTSGSVAKRNAIDAFLSGLLQTKIET
jgi:hypothetical protein